MVVIMRVARYWQDAGRERPLAVGQAYALPDGVATALIATGAAVAVPVAVIVDAPLETVIDPPLERKPVESFETGRQRRRSA